MTAANDQKTPASIFDSSLTLPAILLLAAILRLLYIGHHSFWLDELFSLKFASYRFADLLREVGSFDNHPPTYYLLLHFWIRIFGDSEISLRMPSAIFSFLSVYFTFKAGELLFDRQVALVAALLLALSGFSIFYAQEARMYSLLAFASVLSVYFLLKFLHQQTRRSLFNLIWSSTLLVYTHLYGLFIIIAENIYMLALLYGAGNRISGLSLKKWLTVQGVIVLLSLPWLGLLGNRVLNIGKEGFWTQAPTVGSVIETFAAFSGTHGALAFWVAMMLLGALYGFPDRTGIGLKVLRARAKRNDGGPVLLALLLVLSPIVLPYIISIITTPIYIIRCTIAGQFAFLLLVAKGVTSLRWAGLRALVLGVLVAVSVAPLLKDGYVHHNATNFRKIVGYLASNAGSNDKIVLCNYSHLIWPFNFYAKKLGIKNDIGVFDTTSTIAELLKKQKVWYVGLTQRKQQCEPALQTLTDTYTRVSPEELSATNIRLYAFGNNR